MPDQPTTSPDAQRGALPQRDCSALENHEAPLLREIRNLKNRMTASRENVAACANAISDLDRVTPRPLTPDDQARAVLKYLSGQDALPNRLAEQRGSSDGRTTP
jgi:hypothetical protein